MESGPGKTTVVGPWGGDGGTSWDDGKYTGIREIRLFYGLCIDSIRVEYDNNGNPILAEKHGGNRGHPVNIKLRYPEEYLVAVSGHYYPIYGMLLVRSLTFKTNHRSFGPYGVEEGNPFTFSMEGDIVVGFMGRSGLYLDAIGFHLSSVQPTTSNCHKDDYSQQSACSSSLVRSLRTPYNGMQESGPGKTTVVGPWGGDGGESWDDGKYTGIREIRLVYGLCIDSICVEYDKNGNPILAEKHGGNRGNNSVVIKLRYPEEYLVAVSGHYYPFCGMLLIRSLTFKTNQRSFGPYGVEKGNPFTFSMEGDIVVGFMGRSGLYLDAIGFRLSSVQPTTSNCHKDDYPQQSTCSFSLVLNLHTPYNGMQESGSWKTTVGPWGGDGGMSWDDGKYTGIKEIRLVYGLCIDSIRVEYDKNGNPILAEKHGGYGGNYSVNIKLMYPEEYLVAVSGHYCPLWFGGMSLIRSLSFKTNQRNFGPYGVEEGKQFTFSMEGDLVVGFMGRSSLYLDAIGFRLRSVQATTSNCHKESGPGRTMVLGPWGGDGGTCWDDGKYNGIRAIRLVYGICIDSIRVEYDNNGIPVLAEKHGGNRGNRSANIKLIYPDEYLVAVSGHYCPFRSIDGMPVIRSLTFKTNQRSFGPYGAEEGKPFTFSIEEDLVVGFMGRSGLYLDAIGFHLSSV